MLTRDQRALFYDLVGTLRETKVFGFRGKYSCKASLPRGAQLHYKQDSKRIGEKQPHSTDMERAIMV